MSNFTTTGIVSSTPTHPSIGWNNSWVVVENNANRELYAQAMYVTNLDDLKITLSSSNLLLDISAINLNTDDIEDLIGVSNTFLNKLTAIKYATSDNQEVEISLLNQLTATSDTHITLLNELTSLQDIKQSEIIVLLQELTSNNANLELNTDNVEALISGTNILLNALTAKEQTISLDVSAININTNQLEDLIETTNTLLTFLTSVNYSTSANQIENNLLLSSLTALQTNTQNQVITLLQQLTSTTNQLDNNTDNIETILNVLTSDNILFTTLLENISTESRDTTTLLNTLTGDNIQIINVLNNSLSALVSLTSIEVNNSVTAVEILNPLTSISITNDVEIHTSQTLTVSGGVTVLNPITAVTIINPVTSFSIDIESVIVSNPVSAVTILNPVTAFDVSFENITISNPVTGVQIINNVTTPVPIQFTDTANFDAFSRLRVSTPVTLFDSKTLHNKHSLFWSQLSSGSGAYIGYTGNGDASTTLSTANAGEFAIRQTTQHFNYQPGKSQLAMFTGILNPEAHCIKRYGLFQSLTATPYTPTVGLYFETQMTSPSSIAVVQANFNNLVPSLSANRDEWNIDKLDGFGVSGKTLTLSAANIFLIDFEWLGVGRVRYGVVINGQICYCHQFNNAGNVLGAYIKTPNLPVRAEIRQITNGESTLKMICCSVMSEGGEDFNGSTRSIDTGTLSLAVDTGTRKAVLGVRLQADKLDSVNKVLNATCIVLASNSGNAASACFKYEILHNPTLTSAGTWSNVNSNSNLQYWRGNVSIVDEGTVIVSGYNGAGGNVDLSSYRFEKFLRLGCTVDGKRDELYLVITPLQANEGVFGSITFLESD